MRLRSLRSAAQTTRTAFVALLVLAASAGTAASQTFTVAYSPACGPGTGCGFLRFSVDAGSNALLLETLTFGSPSNYTFVPPGGAGIYFAMDDNGGYGGATSVDATGQSVFIDFTESGAFPPFTLGAGSSGWVEVEVAETEAPAPFFFTYSGTLATGGTISGTINGGISTVPEPGSVVLLATGLAGLGLVARRRVLR